MITAVIPAKANSSRLPNKNILPFGESNLLIHKIRQIKSLNCVDRIIVSTDSDLMLEMAKIEGIEAIRRPTEFADESRPLADFFDYICDIVKEGDLLWACCTSPCVKNKTYEKALEMYKRKLAEGHDSVITVCKYQHYLFNEDGPLNFGYGSNHKNSDQLPILHLFTNGVIIAPIESVKIWRYNYGPRAYKMEIDQQESIDIDTFWDYICAKSWHEAK
jgi:CMP-N-acetylneuraminic acid synthetase